MPDQREIDFSFSKLVGPVVRRVWLPENGWVQTVRIGGMSD